jgi:hypothetical protein
MRTPLKVQNQMGNKSVFAKVVDGNSHNLRWEANGYPGDTLRVPYALIEDTDFINSLESGVLKVVSGPPEIMEALAFETEQVQRDRAEAEQKATDMLDRRQDRDIVGATCIGPGPEGRTAACGRALLQSAKQKGEQPPLCTQHAHLAPNYYLAEAGSQGEGATEAHDGVVRREWKQVQMTARQRQ